MWQSTSSAVSWEKYITVFLAITTCCYLWIYKFFIICHERFKRGWVREYRVKVGDANEKAKVQTNANQLHVDVWSNATTSTITNTAVDLISSSEIKLVIFYQSHFNQRAIVWPSCNLRLSQRLHSWYLQHLQWSRQESDETRDGMWDYYSHIDGVISAHSCEHAKYCHVPTPIVLPISFLELITGKWLQNLWSQM